MTKIILSFIAFICLILNSILIKQGNFGITPFLCWIIAIICTIYIFLPVKTFPKIYLKHHHFFIITLIIFLYSLRGLLFIDPSNVYFHNDEGIISRNAQNNFTSAISSGKWNLLGSENGTLNKLPSPWYFIQGFFISILGPSLFSIKFFSLITDFLICILGYLLVKKILDSRFGLLFILIYASLPISIHFSLTGYQNIQSTFFLVLSIYFLFNSSYNNINKSFFILLSGIASALSFYFYLSAAIVPIIVVASILLICFMSKIKFKGVIKTLIIYLIGLIEGLIPYFTYNFFHYSFIAGRKEAILFSSSTNNFLSLLLNQAKTYFLGFLPNGSMNGSGLFYGYLPGFSTWILLIIFLLGVVYILFKKNNLGIVSIIVITITSVFGGIMTSEPPAPQRLIHIFPFIAIIVCFGIKFITIFLKKIIPFFNQKILLFSIIFIVIFTNVYSFISSNLPTYHKLLNQDVYEITKIINRNSQKLFFSAPIHKIDQIYYYSQGKINPEPISENDFVNIDTGYYFVDEPSFTLLKNSLDSTKYELVKEWFGAYDHITLLKL